MDEHGLRKVERALSAGTWVIVSGAVLFSVLTVTPLVAAHTPEDWRWTAPILPIVVDTAVVIVVRLDAVLARLGGHGGRWPVVLRWMTGLMTLALNTGHSALRGDVVGMAIHAVAPLLLIVTAEAGLSYRRALADAVTRQEAQREARRAAREQAAREREQAARAEREAAREAEERRAREEREHAARLAREEREHAAQLAREQREAEREREERQREHERQVLEREARQREHESRVREEKEREQKRRQAEARARQEAAERAARETAERRRQELLSAGPAQDKQPEDVARETVRAAFEAGLPVRAAAELCGWSVGWVTARYHELREPAPALAGTGGRP
ncbi:DUF2637 domain-containing protein [Streptomyces chumphonensis]|uniref:DUF2637 domain-containing protein n=1 Tax=Streptomyces chumphonensis TaxID=1214925 RepID=UPI003D710B0B